MTTVLTILFCSVGLVGYLAFMIAWHVLTGGAWLRHHDRTAREVARMLMGTSAAWVLFLGMAVAYRLFGEWPSRRVMLAGLFGVLMIKPWWWLRVVWQTHRKQVSVRESDR